ncbi:hypothetical protein AMJ49_03125 [Parcubacteria bacterium DG_74_2]|nr:MAG: hypothetical protein AMJ49_03125 [Parcubacteria bacterium DG_74_2]
MKEVKQIKKNRKNTFRPRILFYTSVPRIFRTTQIGHLFEISQRYPVILLSEKLDPETEKILKNKELFPKLERVIPVRQFDQKRNPFIKNRELYKLAKLVIKKYKPNILIFGDMPFELYLSRFAKKEKLIQIVFQGGFQMADQKEVALFHLLNASFKWPTFLPLSVRLFLSKCKQYLGHFFYYWILPLSIKQVPFKVKSSFILKEKALPGKTVDYYIVYSKRDYHLCLRDGLLAEKLYILPHPLKREKTKKFFERVFSLNLLKKSQNNKTLVLMWPAEQIGFKKSDLSLISKEDIQNNRIKIITTITKIIEKWKIYVKPHPAIKSLPTKIQKKIECNLEEVRSVSHSIWIADPLEPADKYIEMSKVIVGLPPASTTLFTASLQCSEKVILSLDLDHQLMGDSYKDFQDIEYIDNEEKFINTLELIRNNKYSKKYRTQKEPNEFSSSLEVLEFLLRKKGLNI